MIVFEPAIVVDIVLKTSLLVAAVGLIAMSFAKLSAAWRHLLWAAALALSLLMPIAVAYLPSWVQVSPPWETIEPWPRNQPAPVTAEGRQAGAESAVPGPQRNGPSSADDAASAAWAAVMVLWLAGALCVLLRNALAHVGLIRWVRRSRPGLSPAWAATLRRHAGAAGFRRRVRVLESGHATGPCTFGLLRPIVLLPAAGAGWPEAQRRLALLHEFAHVRRLDYLTTQVACVACAVHWFNPLVWYAAIQARKLQEQACDDVVLNAGTMPSDYAEFLVGLAGGSRRPSPVTAAAVGMVQRSQLHGRVAAILDASRARLPLGRYAPVAVLAPLAGLMFLLATVSTVAAPHAVQREVPLAASFNSIELRNGGKLHLVHGQAQGVTVLKGDPQQASIAIRDDGRLVVDRCPTQCPRNRNFEVEVVTPALAAMAVAEGGAIQVRGGFPPQAGIDVDVSQGGAIDIRSLPVANVTASVFSGGRIFARPAASLSADVEQGGNITYWGDAVVASSVRHGGIVVRGDAADEDRLLAELMGPQFVESTPPIPPVPSIAPILPTRR